MSIVSTAVTAALDSARKLKKQQVTISDGTNTVTLDACIGQTEQEQMDAFGALEKTNSRAFLVKASELKPGGTVALPSKGWTIAETIDSVTRTYEVMSPSGSDDPPWRYVDDARTWLRIFTKKTAQT